MKSIINGVPAWIKLEKKRLVLLLKMMRKIPLNLHIIINDHTYVYDSYSLNDKVFTLIDSARLNESPNNKFIEWK